MFESREILITGLLLLLTLISGVWLTHSGRPLNASIFAAHKIIVLLTIIATVWTIYQLIQGAEMRTLESSAIVITGLALLVAFVSGALLSFDQLVNKALLTTHQVIPFLAVVSTAVTLYFLTIK